MFDADYGPYRGDPRDPRYDSAEEDARDEWELDTPYLIKIGEDAIEEILYSLQYGDPEAAKADLGRAVEAAWQAQVERDRDEAL